MDGMMAGLSDEDQGDKESSPIDNRRAKEGLFLPHSLSSRRSAPSHPFPPSLDDLFSPPRPSTAARTE
jgi:hypothetical protein